uniref:Uncharacterized protein n=1 Tax=Oryza sativa subsp. japonica TaxID=39947 RepID=Q6K6Q4_ORYSJ|nr:hypothetical protein [Oryza sativa Japonica Group]BAD23148.1 hypothetical protein [Oryza sativa Japonica Group]
MEYSCLLVTTSLCTSHYNRPHVVRHRHPHASPPPDLQGEGGEGRGRCAPPSASAAVAVACAHRREEIEERGVRERSREDREG